MIHMLVSACLLGENCKWDGGNNRNGKVIDFLSDHRGLVEAHPVCPEQMGGLSTPRPASEIREADERVVNTEGRDVTAEFMIGAEEALRTAKRYECACALLKERSPSCGTGSVYDGSFSHRLADGMGKTADALSRYGIPVFGESSLAELRRFLLKSGERKGGPADDEEMPKT